MAKSVKKRSAVGDRGFGKPVSVSMQNATKFMRKVRQVIAETGGDPDQWAENQSGLAESLMKRFSLTKNSTDLDEAVRLLQEAIEVATPNSPHFIDAQHQLGNALSRRYESSQEPHDLEEALQAYEIALN